MGASLRRVATLALGLAMIPAGRAPAQERAGNDAPSAAPARFALLPDAGLLAAAARAPRLGLGEEGVLPSPEAPRLGERSLRGRTALVTGSFLAGTAAGGYLMFWKKRPWGEFLHWSEDWFSEGTYAGGGDKSSHFVFGYVGGRLLLEKLEAVGQTPARARLISMATIAAAGALIEVGDGFTLYRFSWEDAVATAAGGAAAALIDSAGLTDTLGFRLGRVPTTKPPDERLTGEPGSYHFDLTTFDVRLAGLLPRLSVEPGIGRFLLVSVTYGARGYQFVEPRYRERQLGLEIGLDLYEVLRALGVKEESGWGRPLLFGARHFRVPFTAIGFRYDLNRGRWYGPDSGGSYSP